MKILFKAKILPEKHSSKKKNSKIYKNKCILSLFNVVITLFQKVAITYFKILDLQVSTEAEKVML